jgi:hypothetical protein
MTVEEIDRQLMNLPISPTTPEDIAKRADLMQKRFELQDAARQRAAEIAAAERKAQWGLPLVNVPPGIDCVQFPWRTVYADIVDGMRVMRITAHELRALAVKNDVWTQLNPEIARS